MFIEVERPKSRENIGRILLELLYKLDIEYKLLSITGNSISNNKTLIDKVDIGLHEQLPTTDVLANTPCFYSQSSYIRCIVYILNRIVKKILETLKSGNCISANNTIKLISK